MSSSFPIVRLPSALLLPFPQKAERFLLPSVRSAKSRRPRNAPAKTEPQASDNLFFGFPASSTDPHQSLAKTTSFPGEDSENEEKKKGEKMSRNLVFLSCLLLGLCELSQFLLHFLLNQTLLLNTSLCSFICFSRHSVTNHTVPKRRIRLTHLFPRIDRILSSLRR